MSMLSLTLKAKDGWCHPKTGASGRLVARWSQTRDCNGHQPKFLLVKIILLCLLRFLDFYQTNKSHSFVITFSTVWRFSPNAHTGIIDFFWRYFHVSTYNTDDNDDTDKSSPPDVATVKWIVSAVNNPGTNTTWSKYSNNR